MWNLSIGFYFYFIKVVFVFTLLEIDSLYKVVTKLECFICYFLNFIPLMADKMVIDPLEVGKRIHYFCTLLILSFVSIKSLFPNGHKKIILLVKYFLD